MIKSIALDISKHLSTSTQTIVMRQGDVRSLTLNIAINEDGLAFDLGNYEARFMASLKNGKVIIEPCEKTGANTLSYTLPTALTAQTGTVDLCYVAIYRDEEWVASTEAVSFYVLPGVDIKAAEAESVLSEFLALKAKLGEILSESKEQQVEQQASWEEQQTEQQALWDAQMQQQEEAWAAQMQQQHDDMNARSEEYQALWEAQMQEQDDAFAAAEEERAKAEAERAAAEEDREAAVKEALESLANPTIGTITITEIDEIWANTG
ncbi:MAG: BppU family phage baseplate upper protein [Eggerthellaceae bacterium]|nr:BppU family phage baseplate upper protein [Eggerthellaceae bacterium]